MFTTFPVKPHRHHNHHNNEYTTFDNYRTQSPKSPRIHSPRPPVSPLPLSNVPLSPRLPHSPRTPVTAPQSPTTWPPRSPHLKRDHRAAHIIQARSPTVPAKAHIPERPAPILQLPGLPPQELPRSVLTPKKKTFKEQLNQRVENSRNWLAQFQLPWSSRVSVIPPVTDDPRFSFIPPLKEHDVLDDVPSLRPKTHDFVSEEASHWAKSAKFADESLGYQYSQSEHDYSRDPPPLYKKHAPEGGINGWLSVAGAFLIQFCTIGYIFTWNVFEDHYNHVYLTDQNPIAVRFIGSIQLFLAFFLSLVSGKLADMGYLRFVVHPGSFIFALCLLLLSFIGEEEFAKIFVLQAIGMGVGIGLVFVPTAVLPSHYFKRRRGLAIGIVMSGGSLGGVLFPSLLRALIHLRGFGGAVRINALIIVVLLLFGNGLIRAPPKPERPVYPVPHLDLAKYSGELGYICAAAGTFLAMLFIYWPVMYLDLLGKEHGVSPNLAFYTIIILSVTGLIARVGLGFASDIVGPWNLMIPVSGFLAIMMFTTCTIQGPKSLVAYSLFYGIFSGAWLSLIVTALSSLASRNSELGTRVGLIFSLGSLAFLLSALVHDGVITSKHVWVIPSAVSGVIFLAVTAAMAGSRMTIVIQKQEKARKKLRMLKDIPGLTGLIIV